MRTSWKAPACVAVLAWVAGASKPAASQPTNTSTGFVDFIRDAVWGGKEGGVFGQGHVTARPGARSHRNRSQPQEVVGAFHEPPDHSAHRTIAEQRMAAIEVAPATRTLGANGKPARFCYVGACCGWGHRLMRQAKTFTHLHYLQNATMIMEWGPCPNKQGVAGSGRDRNVDFSSLMIDDSSTLVNFQTNNCHQAPNSDCMKCGAGNDISAPKWEEVVKHFGRHLREIGNGGSTQITAGSFFEPFQFFIRTIMTQLKPDVKIRIANFLTHQFGGQPVIGVHHRHGNGELDDFVDKKTGAPSGRLNKNNTKVIEWMQASVSELAAAYGIKNYKIFFATDSPEMARMFLAHDPRVFVFDQSAKEALEGKGFVMPGWQGWGRSPGLSPVEKGEFCEDETLRAFLDMALLGYVDMLVISKRSSFTFAPSIMMAARQKPVCAFVDGRGKTSFTCRSTLKDERKNLVARTKEATGLAPSSRRL